MKKNEKHSLFRQKKVKNQYVEGLLRGLHKGAEIGGGGSGGGGSASAVPMKDVNFYDYDGTRLYSYTVAEAQALTELPSLPTRKGLICQEWNWTLDDIKAHNRAVDVGATYITDDGKTRLYIALETSGSLEVPLYFSQTIENGVTIDWGDGSVTQTVDGIGNVSTIHTYTNTGEYIISFAVMDGCELGLGNASECISVIANPQNSSLVAERNVLYKAEIGNNITTLGGYAFNYCHSLANITIPKEITNIEDEVFDECNALRHIVIPNGVTTLKEYVLCHCRSLVRVGLPNSITTIEGDTFSACESLRSVVMGNNVINCDLYAFYDNPSLTKVILSNKLTQIAKNLFGECCSLTSIKIPDSVTSIGNSAFSRCHGMAFYDFTSHTSIPTLSSTSAFDGIPSDCEIRVPAALYDEWKAATNWSTYADKIVPV